MEGREILPTFSSLVKSRKNLSSSCFFCLNVRYSAWLSRSDFNARYNMAEYKTYLRLIRFPRAQCNYCNPIAAIVGQYFLRKQNPKSWSVFSFVIIDLWYYVFTVLKSMYFSKFELTKIPFFVNSETVYDTVLIWTEETLWLNSSLTWWYFFFF